ncbi:hypothetical protein ACF07F_16765 [Streptomyces sp. NPDC015237]|uniref:hypothetical protein n=1 Tax=Streptomyces sp. NPDC015237 TaxID=3364949 RepID=UPI0037023734
MSEERSTTTVRKAVRAQICFSDELPPGCAPFELPAGRMMMEVELDDVTLIIIRPGSMDRGLFEEWNRYLDRVTSQGNWSRDPSRGPGLLRLLGSMVQR